MDGRAHIGNRGQLAEADGEDGMPAIHCARSLASFLCADGVAEGNAASEHVEDVARVNTCVCAIQPLVKFGAGVVGGVCRHILIGLSNVLSQIDTVPKCGASVCAAKTFVQAVREEGQEFIWTCAVEKNGLVCILRALEKSAVRLGERTAIRNCV